MNDISRNFFKNYAQASNTARQKHENLSQTKRRVLPEGDSTLSCSFRLRSEEISFIESLPGKSLTEKLRLLLNCGRGIRNAKESMPAKKTFFDSLEEMHNTDQSKATDTASSVDVLSALVTRIEKLEAAQRQC